MEILQQFYTNHPFATALIATSLISLILLKVIAIFGKLLLALSVVGLAYYFFAMSPEQQSEFNKKAKTTLEPILGKIEKMNPPSIPEGVSQKFQEGYNNLVNEE